MSVKNAFVPNNFGDFKYSSVNLIWFSWQLCGRRTSCSFGIHASDYGYLGEYDPEAYLGFDKWAPHIQNFIKGAEFSLCTNAFTTCRAKPCFPIFTYDRKYFWIKGPWSIYIPLPPQIDHWLPMFPPRSPTLHPCRCHVGDPLTRSSPIFFPLPSHAAPQVTEMGF